MLGLIESNHGSGNVVICSKISPKWDEVPIDCQKANYHFLTENVI
jgi:hypothetical protein